MSFLEIEHMKRWSSVVGINAPQTDYATQEISEHITASGNNKPELEDRDEEHEKSLIPSKQASPTNGKSQTSDIKR